MFSEMDELVNKLAEIEKNDRIFKLTAKILWKQFTALMDEGFSAQFAIEILSHQGFKVVG
jgi:hypothetical protein